MTPKVFLWPLQTPYTQFPICTHPHRQAHGNTQTSHHILPATQKPSADAYKKFYFPGGKKKPLLTLHSSLEERCWVVCPHTASGVATLRTTARRQGGVS